jgi:hypothetical protein
MFWRENTFCLIIWVEGIQLLVELWASASVSSASRTNMSSERKQLLVSLHPFWRAA